MFSAELLWCLFLCRKSTFEENSGKYAKNPILPEEPRSQKGGCRRATEGPHPPQVRTRPGRAWGRCGRLRVPLDLSFGLYIAYTLKQTGGSTFSREEFRFASRERNPNSATRNSVLAPCRDGKLEEMIAIIITDASPSTIHDSPIQV